MATATMVSGSSPFNPMRTSPSLPSPLARLPQGPLGPHNRPTPSRNMTFARSRPLRPFPSVAGALSQPKTGQSGLKGAVKLIEPSKKFQGTFTLNLTQAELSRQD
ncbi:hypothetical protein GLOTRDRAFT_53559 [Gloeophyllum trabeum ATCC 11539]|uniref:Uncharacterized protein n=1 Tax=Gloeophyllum trabeum (strain ATCC 11539 / FP-39264 / Madison 617) TaxID=670483 RepID=S7S0R0_GLOTA|nr:uncharacterized protein GLOTRDRAFT_53559 [Gloeophyllum trabeum ATCC 11539]EPQ60950.1 hypothetical protein GLOTRDRAFT_53559 [Gloeophyllum trabeum ATCC 11539]